MTRFVFLGDFSGLSLFMARGLERLGHDAILLSNGDHWKNIPRQQDIWRPAKSRLGSIAHQLMDFPALLRTIGRNDVLLIATEYLFSQPFNGLLLERCLDRCGQAVLLHAGCSEAFNAEYNDSALCRSCKQYDLQTEHCKFELSRWPGLRAALQRVDVIVPFTKIYQRSAQGYARLGDARIAEPLHFPVDMCYLQSMAKTRPTPAVIHGTNRPGFKGTVLLKAMMRDHPGLAAQINITERMGFMDFLGTVASTRLVLDQLFGNGYGMTGAIALALGTAVAYGHTDALASTEFLGPGCVAIPIRNEPRTDADTVYEHLSRNLDAPVHADDLRQLCSQRHDHVAVAMQLLERLQAKSASTR